MLRDLITALQFLTILPQRRDRMPGEAGLARAMAYFPLVGFLIGLCLVAADSLFLSISLPQTITNLLLVLLSVLVTRALHIDGLADTFDGLMGGHDKESRLAIMKDSRLGTAGGLAIFFVLFLKYLCLNNLSGTDKVVALLLAPMLARWSQLLLLFRMPYAREEGTAQAFVGRLTGGRLIAATLFSLLLAALVTWQGDPSSLVLPGCLVLGVAVLTFMGRRVFAARLGGVTGDTIGAVSEVNEALVFLLFVILSGIGL